VEEWPVAGDQWPVKRRFFDTEDTEEAHRWHGEEKIKRAA
jgi:hypothetical protein